MKKNIIHRLRSVLPRVVGILSITAVITLFITACTTLRVPSYPSVTYHKQSWQQRQRALSLISQWNIDGAFSIQQPGKTVIAAYNWQQNGSHYRIRVHSTLDIYSVNISGQPGKVTLWRSPQKYYTAHTPEQLMQEQLGWQLPVSDLYYWMRGIPAPGSYQGGFDAYGHLVSLQQDGWRIRFSLYIPIEHVDLPRSLQLNKGQFAIKIVIKHWQL